MEMLVEGYHSIEEQAQDYIRVFMALQQKEDVGKLFREEKRRIEEKEHSADVFLPSLFLRGRYALTETEYWLVMLAFCCEIEGGLCLDFRKSRQERLPDMQYGLHLLSPVLPVDFGLLGELCEKSGRLGDILQLPEEEQTGLLSAPLVPGAGAFRFLLTGDFPEETVYSLFLPEKPESGILPGGSGELLPGGGSLPLYKAEHDRLHKYLFGNPSMADPPKILLHGVKGCGKHTLVKRVCGEAGVNAVFVRAAGLLRETEENRRRILQTLRLICRLADPVFVPDLAGAEDMAENDRADREEERLEEAFLSKRFSGCRMIFLTESRKEAECAGRFADIRINLPEALSGEEVKLVLESRLPEGERREWQQALLGRYRFSVGELKRKLKAVNILAAEKQLTLGDMAPWEEGLREHSMDSGLGKLIESRYTLDDIVLPRECREQLETITKLAGGWIGEQGLHLLFHGSSGTGKTMAASALAGELKLPLFKVDLSRIFDKYIGETEKHLDEIFRVAKRGRGLLFFDEADALFGRRTGLKDAHDRYANVSTAYLLQRIEEYDGIVILATNLLDQFDDAFVRRIRFVIRFRNPDREDRERMWKKVLWDAMPVAENVSPSELARAADLSPARIKAAAQVAGLLARCGGSEIVTGEHIRKALELEAGKDETALKLSIDRY
ncbi:MAG: ATP-binding protein [Lachnospiraceae bacterium]|nr:ATP-binding protein [Acetatifactor muris]MCM1223726.1 ATP-binding protein [Lachnospiraceae bacterium]MCM1560007.1 ATP-binding protein [Butyrivibrio sp.]